MPCKHWGNAGGSPMALKDNTLLSSCLCPPLSNLRLIIARIFRKKSVKVCATGKSLRSLVSALISGLLVIYCLLQGTQQDVSASLMLILLWKCSTTAVKALNRLKIRKEDTKLDKVLLAIGWKKKEVDFRIPHCGQVPALNIIVLFYMHLLFPYRNLPSERYKGKSPVISVLFLWYSSSPVDISNCSFSDSTTLVTSFIINLMEG